MPSPPPKRLDAFHRAVYARKHLFAEPGRADAQYFVVNPVPQKHAGTWKPVFYRGDNPKYCADSRAVARARRTAIWHSFDIELGEGVHEVLENKRRRRERRSYERGQKWRRWFRMKPTPPKKELQEEQDVVGLVLPLTMRRRGFLLRSLKWELDGNEYTWKGTRRFLPSKFKRCKGISHDFKLVDADNAVLATFEKDRWSIFKPQEKTGQPPNKKKKRHGGLCLYLPESSPGQPAGANLPDAAPVDALDGSQPKPQASKPGDLLEEAVVFTSWIVVEAEHRLRYKIFDVIEEVAENLQE